ncbi:hypothetical protein [Paraburkholderia caribensis]|uniref:hypothetical protein n=1 Tax=Paraburkholderia caribensis TaxID=75105 RepID=UPI001CC35B00|nr:hypothetical protein [Paraburkholderia caribensis]
MSPSISIRPVVEAALLILFDGRRAGIDAILFRHAGILFRGILAFGNQHFIHIAVRLLHHGPLGIDFYLVMLRFKPATTIRTLDGADGLFDPVYDMARDWL